MNSGPTYALIAGMLIAGWMIAQGEATEPAPPRAPAAKHKSAAEVTLTRATNGHFFADAEIGGANIVMLADTGASAVVLSEEDAERAGLSPETLDYTMPVVTAGGWTRAAEVTLDEVRIGPIVRRDIRGFVVRNVDVSLLGMSFFNTLSGYEASSDELVLKD